MSYLWTSFSSVFLFPVYPRSGRRKHHDPYVTETKSNIKGAISLTTNKLQLYLDKKETSSAQLVKRTYYIYQTDTGYLYSTFDYGTENYEKLNLKFTYSSDDPSIATISSTGMVQAKKAGKTTIRIIGTLGGIKKVIKVRVNVK